MGDLIYSNVKSQYLIPQSDIKNVRTEFHIQGDGRVLLSNMRLINVGLFGVAGKGYNRLCGINSIIENITLYDGSQVLSRSENHKNQSGWKAFHRSNDFNDSRAYETSMSRNAYSWQIRDFNRAGDSTVAIDMSNQEIYSTAVVQTAVAENATQKGLIHLADYLPLLQAFPTLSTDIFPNLRLVVEYNQNFSEMLTNDNATAGLVNTMPILVAEEVFDEKLKNKMVSGEKLVNWFETETDSVRLAAQAGLADQVYVTQQLNTRINGFNNKYVDDIWIKTMPTTTAVDNNGNVVQCFGYLGSRHEDQGTYNLRINGVPLYPREGLNKPSMRLRAIADRYTKFTAYQEMNNLPFLGTVLENANDCQAGKADYAYLQVKKNVEDLVFTFSREHQLDNNNDFNHALTFTLFGRVAKSMKVSKGSYKIGYS